MRVFVGKRSSTPNQTLLQQYHSTAAFRLTFLPSFLRTSRFTGNDLHPNNR